MDTKNIVDNFDRDSYQPIKINLNNKLHSKLGSKLNVPEIVFIDTIKEQVEELFLLRNPAYKFKVPNSGDISDFVKKISKNNLRLFGNWFYFPWSRQLVHFLPEILHLELRTGRNKNLITEKEQKKIYFSTAGIAGLSVGSHVALTLTLTGGPKFIKLADPDSISGSNLNRIRAGFYNIGVKKAISVARQIFEINPYSKIEIYDNGLNKKNISEFLSKPKINILIEEMDDPFLKILVREKCRSYQIPVIMAADNSDGIIVDVERYDKKKKYPILHGILKNMGSKDFQNIAKSEIPNTIAKIAGAQFADKKMLESVLSVGKSLYSWPQLGNAATLCGSVLTYLYKQIVTDQPLKSGRQNISIEKFFYTKTNKANKQLLKLLGIK